MMLWDCLNISFNRQTRDKRQKKGDSNLLPLLIFGLFFFIIGSVGSFLLLYLPLQDVIQSRQWENVDAAILTSYVKSDTMYQGGGGQKGGHVTKPGYSIAITYEYFYNKIRYIGKNYDFFRSENQYSSSGKEKMDKIVRQHPVGSKIVCLVNPDVPKQSVISRDIYYPSLLIGFVPVLLLTTAIVFFLSLLKKLILSPQKEREK